MRCIVQGKNSMNRSIHLLLWKYNLIVKLKERNLIYTEDAQNL